jgi:hypothetical protein
MEGAKTSSNAKSRKFFSGFNLKKAKATSHGRGFDLPFDVLSEIVGYLPGNCVLKLCLLVCSVLSFPSIVGR